MLLTLTTTHNPATDLGYLLHKNPAKLHSFELSFGKAHVFYPEATSEKCTAALLLDVDPVGLVRGKRGQHEAGTLDQYVNDRPYVLSSFLSVAMGRAFGTAMWGRSKGRQELADLPIPLTANLTVVAEIDWRSNIFDIRDSSADTQQRATIYSNALGRTESPLDFSER